MSARTGWIWGAVSACVLAAPAASWGATPHNPCLHAIALLDAPLPAGDPVAYAERIRTIPGSVALCSGHPEHPKTLSATLFRVFVRSRYGSPGATGPLSALPEDPDFFEAALQALSELPAEAVVAGADAGLKTGLVELTASRLRHDWLQPAAEGLPSPTRAQLSEWQPKAVSTRADALVALIDRNPEAALEAMTVGGGSLAQQVVLPIQDALLADLVDQVRQSPAALRAVLGVIVDGGIGGTQVAASLAEVQATDPATAQALDRARTAVGQPAPPPPLSLPSVAPGRVPGLEWRPPEDTAPHDVIIETGAIGSTWGHTAWLLAGGLLLGVGVVLSRRPKLRPVAGIAVAGGVLGLLNAAAARVPTPAPVLFDFEGTTQVQLHPVPGEPGRVWTGGGSMRLSLMDRTQQDPPLVAFLGASTVHGSHYVAADTLPAHTARRTGFRSLNLGIGGATSTGVAAAGLAALDAGADLLVVLYGHNEAAQFTRLALYQHTDAAALTLRHRLAEIPLYRLLTALLADSTAAPTGELYRTEPPARAEVTALTRLAAEHLERTLGSLFETAHQQSVPVLVVVPPTNLRFAHLQPFDSPGPGDAAHLDRLRADAETAAQGGRPGEARALFQEAIDRSASPRELTTAVRAALIQAGLSHGARVVDGQAWMCAHAPDGVTPSGLFWDDLHPTAEGHAVLAELVAPHIVELLETRP